MSLAIFNRLNLDRETKPVKVFSIIKQISRNKRDKSLILNKIQVNTTIT